MSYKILGIGLLITQFLGIFEGKAWIRIYLKEPQKEIEELLRRGIDDFGGGNQKKGYIDVYTEDLQKVQGFDYEILDPDYTKRIEELFEEGILINFGPYYTYAEAVAALDWIHNNYPHLTTPKINIGMSWENRVIWAMKISDNPLVNENEPRVLLTGVHHAREPIGASICIEFAKYLLSRYNSDPLVNWLLNNRELWIVPVINPDGYVFNETYSSGMWRKNKRDNNNNGQFETSYDGVDLNRNYGYMWGYDNTGSSPNPSSETYRGPSPFSEPETRAIRILCDSIQPAIALNYHSYSNLLIYPYGYAQVYTPDHQTFVQMAQIMTQVNGYEYGTAWELLYLVNGSSDDWMYGDQIEKPKIFAFTPEVGEAFWQPDTNIILEQIEENLPMNLYVLKSAGPFVEVVNYTLLDQNNSSLIEPGDTVRLTLRVRNISPVSPVHNLRVVVTSLLPNYYLTLLDSVSFYGTLNPLPNQPVNPHQPLRFVVHDIFPQGASARFLINLVADNFEFSQPFNVLIGNPVIVFQDNFNNLSNWQTGGNQNWGLSYSYYYSPPSSATDSPSGNYGNNINSWLKLINPVNLTDATFARLIYRTRYRLENNYDYGRVQISTDNQTWITLKSYTGNQQDWFADTLNLTPYVGNNIWIRFLLTTDGSVVYDGWYIDDLVVERDLPMTFVKEFSPLPGNSMNSVIFQIVRITPDEIHLFIPKSQYLKVRVYDITGKLQNTLFEGMAEKGEKIIKTNELRRGGIYFVKIESDYGSKTYKILKVY